MNSKRKNILLSINFFIALKAVITPTYYYPAVSIDYWDIVFISQV